MKTLQNAFIQASFVLCFICFSIICLFHLALELLTCIYVYTGFHRHKAYWALYFLFCKLLLVLIVELLEPYNTCTVEGGSIEARAVTRDCLVLLWIACVIAIVLFYKPYMDNSQNRLLVYQLVSVICTTSSVFACLFIDNAPIV